MSEKIKQEIINNAIEEYIASDISIVKCAKKYNIGATTLTRYLNDRNIKVKSNTGKTYFYNEEYFKVIDSEEKAYWLGFIAADGSIINNGNALEIKLARKDKNHLLKFINAIDGDVNMVKDRMQKSSNGKYYPISRLLVVCKKLCSDLNDLGVVPKKGNILRFPTNMPSHLISHYLRGYFDGDGSICTNGCNKNGSKRWSVNIIATYEFLDEFMNHITNIGITKVKLQRKENMSVWNKVGINQIRTFLKYLYENSNIYLYRKHKLFNEICRLETKATEVSR